MEVTLEEVIAIISNWLFFFNLTRYSAVSWMFAPTVMGHISSYAMVALFIPPRRINKIPVAIHGHAFTKVSSLQTWV